MAFPSLQQHRLWCRSQSSHVWRCLAHPGGTGQAQGAVEWQQDTRSHDTSISNGGNSLQSCPRHHSTHLCMDVWCLGTLLG